MWTPARPASTTAVSCGFSDAGYSFSQTAATGWPAKMGGESAMSEAADRVSAGGLPCPADPRPRRHDLPFQFAVAAEQGGG